MISKRIQIDGENVACSNSCQAIVDSGTTLIVGPKEETDMINMIIGAINIGDDTFVFRCNQKLDDLPGFRYFNNIKIIIKYISLKL